MEQEEWRPVPGYEGVYEVSSLGRMRVLAKEIPLEFERSGKLIRTIRRTKSHILSPGRGGGGKNYHRIVLTGTSGEKAFAVHRLVCEAFNGPPSDGQQASHLDGDTDNNRADNLRWETPTDNNARKNDHGTMARGERSNRGHLTEHSIRAIRALREIGWGSHRIAKAFGVSKPCIQAILSRRTWTHID